MMTKEEAKAAIGKRVRNVLSINGSRGLHFVLEEFEEGPSMKFVTAPLDRVGPAHDWKEIGLQVFVTHNQWQAWPPSMKNPR
jgi:hypothetical protein